MKSHKIDLTKVSSKTLNTTKIKDQLTRILARVVSGGRSNKGWSAKLTPGWETPTDTGDGNQTYNATIIIKCQPKRKRSEESLSNEFERIVKVVTSACNGPGWIVKSVDGDAQAAPNTQVTYVDVTIPEDWRNNFSHIYGRDEQIDLLIAPIKAAISSNWSNRFHTLMIGAPASGKTDMCRSLVKALGDETCLQYDATSTTQAGAIEDLRNRDTLPRILVIEEIEKTDENSLRWLLGVLDDRAELRKTTFRQDIKRECRMLGIATVNDYKLFTTLMDGALASRFCNPIFCPPPRQRNFRIDSH